MASTDMDTLLLDPDEVSELFILTGDNVSSISSSTKRKGAAGFSMSQGLFDAGSGSKRGSCEMV